MELVIPIKEQMVIEYSKSWPVNCCKIEGIITDDVAAKRFICICYSKFIGYTIEKSKAGINSKPSCLNIELL